MRLSLQGHFGLLIACQAAHSIEEYRTGLYEVFAPARLVSTSFGIEPGAGFIVANLLLNLFGLWCWLARVRPRRGAWRGLAWFWALIETGNGIGHLLLALAAGGYFPGAFTAPLLLVLGLTLVERLRRSAERGKPAGAP